MNIPPNAIARSCRSITIETRSCVSLPIERIASMGKKARPNDIIDHVHISHSWTVESNSIAIAGTNCSPHKCIYEVLNEKAKCKLSTYSTVCCLSRTFKRENRNSERLTIKQQSAMSGRSAGII